MRSHEADTLFTCIYHILMVIISDHRQQPTSGVGVVMAHVGWVVRRTHKAARQQHGSSTAASRVGSPPAMTIYAEGQRETGRQRR